MRSGPELTVNGLGPGWEQTERALAVVQADLSRTVPDAPTLMLLWYDDEQRGHRHAFVGKAVDWYFGADGGFELVQDYGGAVFDIAEQVQAAVADNLLGYLWAWPLCPNDGRLLSVRVDKQDNCTWVCDHGCGHLVGAVGRLGAP